MGIETVRWAAEALRRLPEPDAAAAFLKQIEQSGAVPDGATAADAADAVLCTLLRRLSGGEARHLFSVLPPGIQRVVQACADFSREHAEVFGLAEFMGRVRAHFQSPPEDTDELVHVVFRALHSQINHKDVQHVARQLPRQLAEAWRHP